MKNFLILLVAVLLLSGCTSLSQVTLRTQPPGGSIIVQGINEKIADGNTIELAKGKYTFTSEKEGFAGTSQKVLVDGKKNLVVTVPLGTGYSRVEISTIPKEKEVRVKETGQSVQDGEVIYLSPGTYNFLLKEEGYKDSIVHQEIDGLAEFKITVPRGQGYGHMSISGSPEGATVRFDNGNPMPLPVANELTAGEHEITVEKKGYYAKTEVVTIKPGIKENLSVSLERIPTSGKVVVTTNPADGTIYFNEQTAGTGSADLGQLNFGTYTVSGELSLNKLTRLTGNKTFEIKEPDTRKISLELSQKEYLFEQEWLPVKVALEKEEKRYRKQRVGNPVAVTMNLSKKDQNSFRTIKNLSDSLQQILRVGDRVHFMIDGKQITVWKRHAELTPEFKLEIAAVQGVGESLSNWSEDKVKIQADLQSQDNILADLAFGLHGERNSAPLLDLLTGQLNPNKEKVYRNVADGTLTLVAEGSENLSIGGRAANNYNGVQYELIEPGSDPIELSWKTPPSRLLLISDQANPLNLIEGVDLLLQEKKMIRLVDNMKIQEVIRLSSGPDYAGWQRKLLEASGPLADQIDLATDEIGPHEQPGMYHRIWIVRYQGRSGVSQRQLFVQYLVATELKDHSGDIFLRRPEEE